MALSRKYGFTIVELLIVIVVIAILAAITVVAYKGIQGRANDSSVQTGLSDDFKKFALFSVDAGSFPKNANDVQTVGLTFSKNTYASGGVIICWQADGTAYAIVGTSLSGNSFYVSNLNSAAQPYSASKVVGGSGLVICPNVGMTSSYSWQWVTTA